MPKILQINISVNRGSTGKIAERIGVLAIHKGWDSYVAYANYNINSQSKTYKIRGKADKFFHQVESALFDRHGLGSTKATKHLIEYIKQVSPDIIHLHNIHGYYVNYKILFSFLKKYNRPIVWTLHDCWIMTGHCAHFLTINCEKWKTQCYKCPLKNDYPSSFLFDRSRKNYLDKKESFMGVNNLTIVSVSNWLSDIVKLSYMNYANLKVIHNGIDLKAFTPSLPKNNSSQFEILSVLSVWNSNRVLYDFAKLRQLLPGDIKITLVGLKPKMIKSLPVGITGICRTNNRQTLVDLYSKSNVLVNVTYADSFPTVNIEALACGTPVITYKTGGSPEAIDHETGIVVEQGNVEELANAILLVRENPFSVDACRKRAEKYFDQDKCFEEYINLYNSILEKS